MIVALYNYHRGDIHAAEMRAAYKVGFRTGWLSLEKFRSNHI